MHALSERIEIASLALGVSQLEGVAAPPRVLISRARVTRGRSGDPCRGGLAHGHEVDTIVGYASSSAALAPPTPAIATRSPGARSAAQRPSSDRREDEEHHDQDRRRVPRFAAGRPRGLDRRRARRRRHDAPDVPAARRHPRPHLRHGARPGDGRRDDVLRRRDRRALRGRPEAAPHAAGLARQARRHRRGDGRHRRRRHPRRRRDRRRDVVAVRRPGRAERGRPALRGEHRAAHQARSIHRRPVPRVGQHRPEGRPVEGAAGPGSRLPAPPRARDRQRHRRARREVRDGGRVREPGVREADDRQLGPRAR